jgi:hypothetical protein
MRAHRTVVPTPVTQPAADECVAAFVPSPTSGPSCELLGVRSFEFAVVAELALRLRLRPRNQLAVLPSSMTYDAPIMNDALSEARNMMIWDLLMPPYSIKRHRRGQPRLFSGVPMKRSNSPVSMGPGAARLRRTPEYRRFKRRRLGQAFNCVLARRVYGGARGAGGPSRVIQCRPSSIV